MDLPTYTSIWRIEKRLYKLYDFNLPVPLPIVQVGVFLGISVVWVLFLQLVRVPFQPPWHVVYLVPPGVLTYLATRPVLEGKRLTELLLSQLRYLHEPRTWCRLTPAHEPDRVTVVATVWRLVSRQPTTPARHARKRTSATTLPPPRRMERVPATLAPTAPAGGPPERLQPVATGPPQRPDGSARFARPEPPRGEPGATAHETSRGQPTVPAYAPPWRGTPSGADVPHPQLSEPPAEKADGGLSDSAPRSPQPEPVPPVDTEVFPDDAAREAREEPRPAAAGGRDAEASSPDTTESTQAGGAGEPVGNADRAEGSENGDRPGPAQETLVTGPERSATEKVRVNGDSEHGGHQNAGAGTAIEPPRAPSGPSAPHDAGPGPERVSPQPPSGWRRLAGVLSVLPQQQQGGNDAAASDMITHAVASFRGTRRVLVLGCAEGAGQTATAVMLGHTLARHRRDRCIAVDAAAGPRSLASRCRTESPETLSSLLSRVDAISGYLGLRAYTSQSGSGLEVIASDGPGTGGLEETGARGPTGTAGTGRTQPSEVRSGGFATLAALLDRYYKVSLFDPAPAEVPDVLPLADQAVLVVPAGVDAQSALNSTLERLDGSGYPRLASGAVVVFNGMRKDNVRHVEQAESIAAGRCRGMLRVPRDDRMNPKGGIMPDPDVLHPPARHAYLHLAATLVTGFSAVPERYRQEVSR